MISCMERQEGQELKLDDYLRLSGVRAGRSEVNYVQNAHERSLVLKQELIAS